MTPCSGEEPAVDVRLNFVNRSADTNEQQVVIFQKNLATGYCVTAVAWTVIQHCGQGENHPFVYPTAMQVAAGDSYGNYTRRLEARPGDAFEVVQTSSGDTLSRSGNATYPTEVQVANKLPEGAISAHAYKDGRLLAVKPSVAPQQVAAFEFQPTIWIGAVSHVVQGQVMGSKILDQINTEISLLGIASADIVMTGGGSGQNAQPLAFILRNIVWA
jgi:hypothetical protein